MHTSRKGFTLIEILLVIAIIAILATVVVVALDPVKRFQDARDARRLRDIQSILDATQQFIIDNKGTLPEGLDTTEKQISTEQDGCAISDNCDVPLGSFCIDLSNDLGRYLKTMPYDPENGSGMYTHYSIQIDASNIVTVKACDSTDPTIASVSR